MGFRALGFGLRFSGLDASTDGKKPYGSRTVAPKKPHYLRSIPGFWSTILEYFFIGPVP